MVHRQVSPLACLPVSFLQTRLNSSRLLTCLQLVLHHQASSHLEHPEEDLEAHQALVEDEVPNLCQEAKIDPFFESPRKYSHAITKPLAQRIWITTGVRPEAMLTS